ncbi:MAG: tape measure protein, partial [Bacteroidia bacterium]|nr:tape measure protein [Bacteroidia bacterium]
MANILEYTLSLNDKLSSKLSTIGINSNSALNKFSQLQKQSLAVAKVMNDFGGSVGALREKLSLLKNERDWISPKNIEQLRRYNSEIKKTERELQRLETINGSRSKKWLGDAMSQIPMAGLLTNPLVIAGAAAGKAVKLGIEQDLQNTAFEVLLNSKGAAKKLVDDITKYGISTPYDKAGLAENAKVLLGFGLAQEKIMPSLKAIGDLAMGDANKMSSLTLAFAQVSSAGKLSGQDLLQMINAGFNPLNEIAKRTGKSIAQLKEDMSDGKVSAKMVEDAFIAATSAGGTFHGMAEKMGQTLGGKLAQLMDQISEKFLKLYNVIQPLVVFFVDVFSVAIDIVADTLGWFFDGIKTGNPAIILLAGSIGVLALAYSAVSIKMRITNIFGKEGIIVSKASAVAKGIEASAVWAVEVATKALNLAMKLTPFGLILTGIAGLIAAYEALSISKKKAMEEYQEDANKRSQESMRSEIDVVEQLTEKYNQLSRSKAYKGQDEVLSKMAITDEQ